MLKVYVRLADFVRSERGLAIVEYALLAVLISVTIVLAAVLILEASFIGWAAVFWAASRALKSPDNSLGHQPDPVARPWPVTPSARRADYTGR